MPNTQLAPPGRIDFLHGRGLPEDVVAAAEEAYVGLRIQLRQFKRQQEGRGKAAANQAAKQLSLGLFEHLRREAEDYLNKHAPRGS